MHEYALQLGTDGRLAGRATTQATSEAAQAVAQWCVGEQRPCTVHRLYAHDASKQEEDCGRECAGADRAG